MFSPLDKDDNKQYEHKNNSEAREDVVVLNTSCLNENLAIIGYEIGGQQPAIADAERIKSVKNVDDPKSLKEREAAEQDLQQAEKGLNAFRALHHEITTHWGAKEKRVFGKFAWAPPIDLSTKPG